MKIPVNLLVFLAVAGTFYLVILPKRTQFVSTLMKSLGVESASREDSLKAMVAARIIVDLCPRADLSEYKPLGWTDYFESDESSGSITHVFSCDGINRKYLFRLRYGALTEIINLF